MEGTCFSTATSAEKRKQRQQHHQEKPYRGIRMTKWGISSIPLFLAVIVFALGLSNYRIQVYVAAIHNKNLHLPQEPTDLYEIENDKEAAVEAEFLPHIDIFRMVNPIYGSVGLLWSRSWQLCQSAVEAVLKGSPITKITSEAAVRDHGPPLKAYDIRHVSKDENSAASNDPHRFKSRCRFKRSVIKPRASKVVLGAVDDSSRDAKLKWDVGCCGQELNGLNGSTSHESSLSHQSSLAPNVEGESKDTESMISVETVEDSVLFLTEPESIPKPNEQNQESDIPLELTLGFEPVSRTNLVVPVKKRKVESCAGGSTGFGACKMELGLDYRGLIH